MGSSVCSKNAGLRLTYKLLHRAIHHDFRPYTFGLSDTQRVALYRLTGGAVDLRNHYYKDTGVESFLSIRFTEGLMGLIRFDMKPPSFESDALLDSKPAEEWIEKLNLPQAWQIATGEGIRIADCDAGYRTSENDLEPNLLLADRYDLSDQEEPLNVSNGPWVSHGTAVAALMAGPRDGKVTGIAYDARIVPLQNYNYDDSDDIDKEEATARCVLRALAIPGVKVIVLENHTATGSSETFAGTREAVKLAIRSGVTIVSAAGNLARELSVEAEHDTGSIIVGAVTMNGVSLPSSNYGNRCSRSSTTGCTRTRAGRFSITVAARSAASSTTSLRSAWTSSIPSNVPPSAWKPPR
jgi:hypothetical protein